jgi:hypothetical protein
MRSMPYLIKHPSGVYYAQRKVVERLQAAVARVLGNGKDRQVYLKRSLGTTVLSQANISIKPVLIDFDRIIREAEALENSKPPVRAILSASEIARMNVIEDRITLPMLGKQDVHVGHRTPAVLVNHTSATDAIDCLHH